MPSEIIFDPNDRVYHHIVQASRLIEDHFDEISSARDVGIGKIRKAMGRVIAAARILGYQDAVKYSGGRLSPASYGATIRMAADVRSDSAARKMRRTTLKGLDSGSNFTLSPARAEMSARYEASRAYFQGMRDGFRGNEEAFTKSWITTSANSCEDCDDNESQGPVGMDELFSSGDDLPPLHQNCACLIAVSL